MLTSDLVLAEAVTLARVRAGFDQSVTAGERLRNPPFEVVWTDQTLGDEAWTIYCRYRDHDLSLCDCVSFAVMRRRKIEEAFEYDADFRSLGFQSAK